VVGTDARDTSSRGSLTGTSALVDSALYVILTEDSKYDSKPNASSCRKGTILLYPDSAHSGTPFREIVEPEPIGADFHGKAYDSDPDNPQGPPILVENCNSIPIAQLKQGTKSITPGTYYVVYKDGENGPLEENGTLELGTVTIP